jgi:Gram-negative bacterial TonB protein C-terminal
VTIGETGEVLEASVVSGHPLLREAAVQSARRWIFTPTLLSGKPVKINGVLTFNFKLIDDEMASLQDARGAQKYKINTERLNDQLVEGIECRGERKVTTMPVGTIGNDRSIEMISETWSSPALGMIILSKRNDPRFGESTYRATNIERAEPEPALFQVSPEYTIKEKAPAKKKRE